ncbi:Putative MFS-type transporter [Tolypocladium paradoxum]|uniref:MFS-type transporter n=1 Tax=Tolypocladium paradoxum TaxID=94208 RepID=A0A2S4KLG6_9HYPO|nr:Putative MFS-type transporter [Tolypocladium paradoxum]
MSTPGPDIRGLQLEAVTTIFPSHFSVDSQSHAAVLLSFDKSSPSAVQQEEPRQPRPSSPDEQNNDSKEAAVEAEAVVGSGARTEVASNAPNARNVLVPIDSNNAKSNVGSNDDSDEPRPKVYHTGWRLHALTAGLCVSLLLSTLETTIVSTSLVSIVDALHGFDKGGWVVTSYLLTYTGFLVIYAKLSDILGCKLMILGAITLFTVFSVAYGVSDSMLPLYVMLLPADTPLPPPIVPPLTRFCF